MASVTVNGVSLSSVAYGVSTRTGWRSAPGIRAQQIAPSNVDGVLVPDRRAPLEPGQIGLSMWVRGRTFAEFTAALDTLMRVFSTQRGTVPVTMEIEPGVTRVCEARTVAAWSVDHKSPLHAEFQAVMEIPGGAWTTEGYAIGRRTTFGSDVPLSVVCDDPTAIITDAVLLIRDPGTAVDITVSDAAVDTLEAQRVFVRLLLDDPVPSNRSLIFDLGAWQVYECVRPDADDVTAAWFDDLPTATTDYTADAYRQGPMWGRTLLALEPGGIAAPREPGVRVDGVDGDTIPVPTPDATLAVRPRWL